MAVTVADMLAELKVSADTTSLKDFNAKLKQSEGFGKRASAGLKQAGKGFAIVGAAATGAAAALFVMTKNTAETADEIAKVSKQLGINAEQLQRVRGAAELSGSSVQTMNRGLRTLTVGLSDAKTKGTGPAMEGLEALGLTVADLEADLVNGDIERVLGTVGDAFNATGDSAEKNAALLKLFGAKGGAELRPLIEEGRAGITKLGDQISDTGGVIRNEALPKFEDMLDSFTLLDKSVLGIKATIAEALVPEIRKVADAVSGWLKENRELIKSKVREWIAGLIETGREWLPTLKSIVAGLVDLAGAAATVVRALEGFAPGMGAATVAAGALMIAIGGMPGLFAAVGVAAFGAGQALARAVDDMDGSVTRVENSIRRLEGELRDIYAEIAELEGRRADLGKKAAQDIENRKAKYREEGAGFGAEFLTKSAEAGGDVDRLSIEGFAIRRAIGQQELRSIEAAAARVRKQGKKQGLSASEIAKREASVRKSAAVAAKQNRAAAAQAATAAFRKSGGDLSAAKRAASGAQASAVETAFGRKGKGGGGKGGGGGAGAKEPSIDELIAGASGPGGTGLPDTAAKAPTVNITITNNDVRIELAPNFPNISDPDQAAFATVELIRKELVGQNVRTGKEIAPGLAR